MANGLKMAKVSSILNLHERGFSALSEGQENRTQGLIRMAQPDPSCLAGPQCHRTIG
jgi:hypothetical protein